MVRPANLVARGDARFKRERLRTRSTEPGRTIVRRPGAHRATLGGTRHALGRGAPEHLADLEIVDRRELLVPFAHRNHVLGLPKHDDVIDLPPELLVEGAHADPGGDDDPARPSRPDRLHGRTSEDRCEDPLEHEDNRSVPERDGGAALPIAQLAAFGIRARASDLELEVVGRMSRALNLGEIEDATGTRHASEGVSRVLRRGDPLDHQDLEGGTEPVGDLVGDEHPAAWDGDDHRVVPPVTPKSFGEPETGVAPVTQRHPGVGPLVHRGRPFGGLRFRP